MVDLENFDEATLERAFADLNHEVNADIASIQDVEAFRLHWLGRKQGRLKLISEAWLKSAPTEARKPLGIRFNQLKQKIDEIITAETTRRAAGELAQQGIDITRPGTPRAPGIPHPLLKTMHEIVSVFH